jgi:Ca-activated chloride channel homolog
MVLLQNRAGLMGVISAAILPAVALSAGPASIRVDKNLVLVPVSVVDRENHPVSGLDVRNFRVFDNKRPQTIESISRDDQPLAVGLVFDASGSMKTKLERSRLAVKAFLDGANPEDEFLLVRFSNRPMLSVPLMNDPGMIEASLLSTASKGRTALLDAVYLALTEIRKSRKSRKALLIISDGGDNDSRHRARELGQLVLESDALIYVMGIYDPLEARSTPEEASGPSLLSWIAEQSGGREYSAEAWDLPEIAQTIGMDLRNRYLLGFSPSDSPPDGRYHSVQVKMVSGSGSPPLSASWRHGYFAATK